MEGLNQDLDAFAYYCDEEYVSIQVFHLRNGKMIERNGYLYQKTEPLEQFQEFIIQFYLIQNNPLPKNIYINDGDIELLSNIKFLCANEFGIMPSISKSPPSG